MKKCLLLGNGGREAVIAEKISKGYSLYAILPYENPSIVEYVEISNGKFIIGNPFDKGFVKNFIKENEIEYCIISSDNLLQEGLIDVARECGLKTFGPTSKGAKIEWSKTYALEIVEKFAPEMIIKNVKIQDEKNLDEIIASYSSDNFVVKPEGLTGGKGVKVGGIHFKGKQEGYEYAKECLNDSGTVIIQDKVEGKEFTAMCLTDGKNLVVTPTTFDYPYRFDNDKGPGTGGMGCLSFENGLLPFLNNEDIEQCKSLMQKTINYLNKDSLEFNGVLYGGFFKCKNGIKFIEFNSRFGDPEALNVLNLLETPFDEVFENIINKNLNKDNCKFKKTCTFTVYIVSKDYTIRKNTEPCVFNLDKENIRAKGAKVYFANSKQISEKIYASVGNSRLFGIVTERPSLEAAKKLAYEVIKENIDESLDYRTDIGTIKVH